MPVLKDLAADKWVADSAAIVDLLEERFPRPPMGKSDAGPDVCVPGLQAPWMPPNKPYACMLHPTVDVHALCLQ